MLFCEGFSKDELDSRTTLCNEIRRPKRRCEAISDLLLAAYSRKCPITFESVLAWPWPTSSGIRRVCIPKFSHPLHLTFAAVSELNLIQSYMQDSCNDRGTARRTVSFSAVLERMAYRDAPDRAGDARPQLRDKVSREGSTGACSKHE